MEKKTLRERLRDLFSRKDKVGFNVGGTILSNSVAPDMNATEQLESYKQWVYACVNAISDAVSDIQIDLLQLKNGEMVEVEDHELLDLLSRVNPFQTQNGFFKLLQTYKELSGEAFVYLERGEGASENAPIREMWLLRPDLMEVIPDKDEFIKGYLYKTATGNIPFEPYEIIHFKYPNPTDAYRGYSPLSAGGIAVDTFNYASEWNKNFFYNSARPDAVLETTDGLSDDEFKRMRAEWEASFRGKDRAQRVAILEAGVSYKPVAVSQKDMDFLQQKEVTRDEILGLYKVPKSILGLTDNVIRANAEASIFTFTSQTIKPKMQDLVDTLNEFLVPFFGDDLILVYKDPTPENRELKIKEYLAGHGRYMTTNEIRADLSLVPIEGGDTIAITTPTGIDLQTLSAKRTDPKVKVREDAKRTLLRRNKTLRLKEQIRRKFQGVIETTEEVKKRKIERHKNIEKAELHIELAKAEVAKEHAEAELKQVIEENKRLAIAKEKAEDLARSAVELNDGDYGKES